MGYYFEVMLASTDDMSLITVYVEDKKSLENKIEAELEHRGFTKDDWCVMKVRPRIGRPVKTTSVPRMVPKSWAYKVDEVNQLLELIGQWRVNSEKASLNSWSWRKMRQFLHEVEEIGL